MKNINDFVKLTCRLEEEKFGDPFLSYCIKNFSKTFMMNP